MTPKQKAKELILKYYFVYVSGYTSIHEVKRAALIAVDEILLNIEATILYHKESLAMPFNKEYWQEVKTEIEKL